MNTVARSLLRALLACALLLWVPALRAQTPSQQWSVGVLDQILAAVPPGQNLAQVGDMQIPTSILKVWRAQLAGGPQPNIAFGGTATTWPGGLVYYTFDSSVSPPHQKAFLDAATEWTLFANVHFVLHTSQANYMLVQENPTLGGGVSAVGMVGPAQLYQIGPSAWNRATICHELGHTLGLVHEHQRSDRDSFVTILTNNIAAGQEDQFVLLPSSNNQSAYDFLSVMHYSRNSFPASPGLDTMLPLPAYSQYLDVMGRQFDPVLSASDRAGMAAVYGAGPVLSPVVTTTADNGVGSLRAALYYAFDHPSSTISFNIPTSDPGFSNQVFNILPTDVFPSLIHATELDGRTEPTNSNPNGPSIQLNGLLAPPPSVFPDGLRLKGTNCVVRSLIVNGFAGSGIVVSGANATSNTVAGCFLGIDPTGTLPVTNGLYPLSIDTGASANTIGGTNAADRNIISGSSFQGLVIRDPGTKNNVVRGNYIGLNAAGTAALSNRWSGVAIFNAAQSNTIGGALPAARNVISGNGLQGIVLNGTNTSGNLIAGDYIGLNPAGTAAISNGWSGVNCFGGAGSNFIGGPVAGLGNVISGNGNQGVLFQDPGTSGNFVQGNHIGLNPLGSSAIPNGWAGVDIYNGPQGNLIGGAVAGARNVISGNGNQGVVMDHPGTIGNLILGNYIGLNAAGSSAVSNAWAGVAINGGAQSNFIGGALPAMRNIISGNGNQGIVIGDANSLGNVVAGNFIGVNPAGTAAIPNTWSGINCYGGASANVIGGTAPGAGNIISGNSIQGVLLQDPGTSGNFVQGNFIGLDVTGATAIPNVFRGIELYNSAEGNLIGGGIGARNVISGNTDAGIAIDTGSLGNLVQGNTIGLNAAGTLAVPNTYAGVVLFNGASSNQIGGTILGTANLIANNQSDGVQMSDASTVDNTVRGNSIFGNSGIGVALYNSANNSGAAPALNSAVVTTNTTVAGSLTSQPTATFHLDFYANPTGAQARIYLGARDVVTSAGGNANFSFSLGAIVPAGQVITATATDLAGNTSPLSGGVTVSATDTVHDGIPDAWRLAHFGSGTTTNNLSCAPCDPDHDGLSNYQEFLAGTDPTNSASALRISSLTRSGSDINLSFQSQPGIVYRIDARASVSGGAWSILADQILGTGGVLQLTDPGVAVLPQTYYRVDVQP